MSILTPSTTPHTEQVWPRLPKPDKPRIVHVPREQRQPVTLDDVKLGDALSVLAEDGMFRTVERVGQVIHVNPQGTVFLVQTEHGRCVLTARNWVRRAPRR